MRKLLLTCVTSLLLISKPTLAGGLGDDHMWSHLGTAYAVQTVTYGFAKQFTDDRTEAVIASAIMTSMATMGYMLVNTSGANTHDFLMDRLGQVLAIGAVYGFQF